MAAGLIIGSIFVFSALGFLIGKATEALAVEEEVPIIEVVPIDEEPIQVLPIDEVPIEEIDIIIPGNAEVLITQIGV